MKQMRNQEETKLSRRQEEKGKFGSGSLNKYHRSPYLQRLGNGFTLPKRNIQLDAPKSPPPHYHSEKKPHFVLDNWIDKDSERKVRSNISMFDQQKNTKFRLPRLDPADHPRTQKSEKFSTASLSATLEPSSKKKKLIPIQSSFRIQEIIKTRAGTNGKQNKINQDIAIVENTLPHGVKLYCVCDGHGLNGHLVSAFIKQFLIKTLTANLKKHLKEPEKIQEVFEDCLKKTNDALLTSEINTELSGSTLVAVFMHRDNIYCFNVGDSRAIMGKQKEGNWETVELSVDQKPSREDQKQRIIKAGGRVEAQVNERGQQVGPLRVWIKDIQMPGLAMTRSFGDKAGIRAGTNAEPELMKFKLTAEDKFIMVASDGIWEYLESEEIVKIVAPFYENNDIELAAEKIMRISAEIWQKISYSRDDITLILVTLNPPHPKIK